MSDFEKLIYASDLIEWIMETDPDWCVGAVRSIVDHVDDMPSAQPEQKNQKTALSVQVKVDFDDMKALLEDIGNLQTYKLSEGDDMVLADIEDIKCILAKHVKAKEVQPERKKGKWIYKPNIYGVAYCSECDFELHINDTPYCPYCGCRMEGNEE